MRLVSVPLRGEVISNEVARAQAEKARKGFRPLTGRGHFKLIWKKLLGKLGKFPSPYGARSFQTTNIGGTMKGCIHTFPSPYGARSFQTRMLRHAKEAKDT